VPHPCPHLPRIEYVAAEVARHGGINICAPIACGCQYSVTKVDLRRLEPADVLMPHPHSLLLRASGIAEGTQEDYRGYMSGQYEDHARLRARRDGSYGPYPPLERLSRRSPNTRKPVTPLW